MPLPRCLITLALMLTATGWLAATCLAGLPTLTVLHTFSAVGRDDLSPAHHTNTDGAEPEAGLVQGSDGTFYGTTASGGAYGTGVVFKINPGGTQFAVLHSFGPLDTLFTNDTNTDGGRPTAALVIGKDGALYGAAAMGGPKGSGTVFKLNPDGSGFTLLHAFEPKEERYHNEGGADPVGLTVAADGTLVGVAAFGGKGRGLVFSLTPDGKQFHVLHAFEEPDGDGNFNNGGAIPTAAVTFGPDGTLYGTANIGGRYGFGVIYKMGADGKYFAVLHNFQRKVSSNGVFPSGSLTFGTDGTLYGVTRQGGAADGGTVYKVSTDGTGFTLLHTFSASSSDSKDGSLPCGPLVFSSDGFIYGVSSTGGALGVSVLFKLNVTGTKFFALHDFTGADGGYSRAGLALGSDGNLYGVSTDSGASKSGAIFRVALHSAK